MIVSHSFFLYNECEMKRRLYEKIRLTINFSLNVHAFCMPATQYDEINELLREINGVNESIVKTIQSLNEKEELLSILVKNMDQGILLIGSIDIFLTQSEDTIEFVIKDTGIGIPKSHQERIFERFYQVNKTKSLYQNGTGLGLAIVKHVVSYYKGNIRVDSEPNLGTTFTVIFHKE